MAKKVLLFLLFFFFSLQMVWGASSHPKSDKTKIEITANALSSTKDVITAKENVLVYYEDMIIKASFASFNRTTKLLILDGEVELIGYEGSKEHSNHIEIYTDSKEVTFKELFMVTEHDVWMMSNNAHKKEGNYTFGASVLSSCDVKNPLWKMIFSDSTYDSEDSYMKVYNAKVYFGDVPVFYSPYLGFTTNNERSSGLLFPSLGYKEEEGFLYEQPIYWAINPSMDLELNPQIRTKRSLGLYSTFRFADTAHSYGEIRGGYFKDNDSYATTYNIEEQEHYGLEFNYGSSKILGKFLPDTFQEGLYINSTYLNDIEYLNLQSTKLAHFGVLPLQESRLNYFLSNNDYYMGVNGKYFIDTRLEDNNSTLQVLPAIQLHKYLGALVWDNLTYSVDANFHNFDRQEGATLKQKEIRIPLEFTTSFFDDYLSLSLAEEFYYSDFSFGNDVYEHNQYEYYSSLHKAKLFSDLTKKYDNFIHVIQPSLEYKKPAIENHSPVDFELLTTAQQKLFSVGLPEEQIGFSLGQYFYGNAMNLIFYQRLTQDYYKERELGLRFSDISNEMQYNIGGWSFYNSVRYSHEFEAVRESLSRIGWQKYGFNLMFMETFRQTLTETKNTVIAKDVNFIFGMPLGEKFKIHGSVTYDVDDEESRQWILGMNYRRDCWSMALSMRRDIIPRPANSTLPEMSNSFFLQFTFTPFGTLGNGQAF